MQLPPIKFPHFIENRFPLVGFKSQSDLHFFFLWLTFFLLKQKEKEPSEPKDLIPVVIQSDIMTMKTMVNSEDTIEALTKKLQRKFPGKTEQYRLFWQNSLLDSSKRLRDFREKLSEINILQFKVVKDQA
jgi:hypothetical protein